MGDNRVVMDLNQGRDVPREETFKILISTDNHIGVHDSNPCRGKLKPRSRI